MSPLRSPSRPRSVSARKKLAITVFQRLKKANPDPRCELYYESPYQLLISVVLSAQATDKSVNACMAPLHKAGFDIQTMLTWGEQKFYEKIKTIGLAKTKARNAFNLTRILNEDFAKEVPKTREELESLPGVGRKTANVILGEIFRHPTLAVDTHVFRVGQRLGLHNEKTPEKAELDLLQVIAPKILPAAHHWLILHGRYTCKAKKPECSKCVLNDLCPSRQG